MLGYENVTKLKAEGKLTLDNIFGFKKRESITHSTNSEGSESADTPNVWILDNYEIPEEL